MRKAFTLIELLVVIAIVAILAAILFPVFAQAKAAANKTADMSNMRQLGVGAMLYMADHEGALFRHHEDYVLDDGSLVLNLPATAEECAGGGFGNSQAEKPWAVFFYPYTKSREIAFSPGDRATRSQRLAKNMTEYSGDNEVAGEECSAAPDGEACLALQNNWAPWSFLLNSVFTHKSCRYAMEGVLDGFATETAVAGLEDPNLILFAPRNSEGFSDPNSDFHAPLQDDYDAWAGEAALVRWGSGSRPEQGWIQFDRFAKGGNYVYSDGHAKFLRWSQARADHFPDKRVRYPLANPPQ
jgi:prepilin-type N-terminal cleavage/methylation domain-containing protein